MWANKEKRSHLRQNLTTKVTEQATESKTGNVAHCHRYLFL